MIKNSKPIDANGYLVEFAKNAFSSLNTIINRKGYSSIFILVDSNSKNLCLKYFLDKFKNPEEKKTKCILVFKLFKVQIYRTLIRVFVNFCVFA